MTERAASALAKAFDGGQAILFGRARSAHLALFEALGLHGRSSILIPSNACPSLLACAWASGAEVRLAPVSAETGINEDAALARQLRILSRPGRKGAVLLTHLYGFRLDFSETRKAASELGWVTVENDANASSFAPKARLEDIARIVSFGPGKVLDAGSGGAVITRDKALAEELKRITARYPGLDDWAERDEDKLMLERRALRNAGRSADIENTLVEEMRQLRFGFDPETEEPLLRALAHLPTRLAERQERRDAWIEALSGFDPHLQVIDLNQTAPWRLIVRADPKVRDFVVEALRKADIDAGTNYPSLSQSFPKLTRQDAHPDADAWSRSVINLWLDARYDAARINTARTVIETELEALT
ncbi:DegT/DnrJ/EryC1/StrS family aminotransferase [Oceanicaulis sp. LC35]|uniref:DegT/DnrJ/EryC1/StrS family aminotransferase n=1 Tax=Oceanicaulis sp. LC35 TaxID=3349635 RepID=UPI003F853EA8